MARIIINTRMGWVGAACSEKGITAVIFPRKTRQELVEKLPADTGKTPAFLTEFGARLKEYFEGKDVVFPDKLDFVSASPLQRKVWEETRRIPYGETRTYGWIAKKAGCRSARAVGQALGRNPFPIIVPCHRVIGSDGKLVGFGGGLEMKEHLLKMEKAI